MLVSCAFVGALSAFLAYKRGKNPYLWFMIGALFGLVGLFIFFFWSDKKKGSPTEEPALTIQGPKDKFWYFLDEERVPQGPISLDALRKDWKDGKLAPNTYIWHDELTEWKQIKDTLQPE